MYILHLLGVVFCTCQVKFVQIFYIFTNFYSRFSRLTKRDILKYPALIVDVSPSPFSLRKLGFIYFEAIFFGTNKFRIVISSL